MATAASPRLLVSPAATDRKFYTGIAVAMLFTALVGFSRTYFLGLISGHARTITGRVPNATVHLHALLFMSWLGLFIVQTSLIATHRVKVHRKLGYFGVALAAAMIVVGGRTAVEAARLGAVPPGAKPWNFIAIPFGDITSFAIFFLGAVLWRNNKDKHKRLMILASASLMSAALVRWPGVLAGAGALARCSGHWTAARLWINAAVPHRRWSVRPVVTRTCPPGVLVGASGDRAGRRGACRSARQPGLGARHAVAVRLACTCALRDCDPKKGLVGSAEALDWAGEVLQGRPHDWRI